VATLGLQVLTEQMAPTELTEQMELMALMVLMVLQQPFLLER
tara:strand:- start:1325 stop:1450 length:126 start_codon:yes stop_codon:yes gene_type:complete